MRQASLTTKAFLQTYTPLAWQAKACNSSTLGLTTRLERLGVKPIEPVDGRGALIKLSGLFDAIKGGEVDQAM